MPMPLKTTVATPTILMALVCAIGLSYILIKENQAHVNHINSITSERVNHIQAYIQQVHTKNLAILPLIKNQWRIIDNTTTGNIEPLIDVIRPLHQHLNHGLINIYSTEGIITARADKPSIFGKTDALTPFVKNLSKTPKTFFTRYENKPLIVSLSPIQGNYGTVGIVASGQFINLKNLLTSHNSILQSQIILTLNGNTFAASTELALPKEDLKQTHIPLLVNSENNGTTLQGLLLENTWPLEKILWANQSILAAVILIVSIILIATTRKTLSLTNQLERTRRESAEQRLQDSQAQVNLLLNSTAEAIYGIDTEGNCTFANQACLDMLQYKDNRDLLGNNMHILIQHSYLDGTSYPPIKSPIYLTLQNEEKMHIDNEVLWRKDGSCFAVEYWSHPIFKNKICIGAVVTFLDITTRIEAEQKARENENNLAITLNSIGDAVIATDSNGYITRMNPVAEQLTGWTLHEAQGQTLKKVFPIINASTREPIENPVEKVITTGETVYLSNHTTLISKNGSEYQIADSAAPIQEKGEVLGMVLVFNDITEQYQLREAAAKNKRDMQAVMDHSHAVIYIKDSTGRYMFINNQFEKLFHVTRESFYDQTDYDLFPKHIADELRENDKAVLESGHAIEYEEVVGLEDDRLTYVSSKFPLYNEQNEIYAVCGISTDITELRQQQEQLRRSQKMDALGKLTGGIAHDYNNILGIVQGYAEQLNEHLKHDTKLSNYANNIQTAAERGAKLTKKLLQFTRHTNPEISILNINTLLQSQHDMLAKTLTARINLMLDLKSELWSVELDHSDLENAIINISINSMHAMETGGELTIRTSNERLNEMDARQLHLKAGDYVLLSITDTGCGMNDATKEQIFDPFYSTKGERGTGLGLSQVYGFIERSDGAIKVYSELGHGSKFALFFPRSKQSISEPTTSTTVLNLQGKETLLVVDDEIALATLAQDILTAKGYTVLTAHDGKQALAILKKENIALVISDVIMPNMDGYQLAKHIQEHYPNIKLQMVSGFTDDRHQGMIDNPLHKNILHKPYTSNTLLECVRRLLDTKLTQNILSDRTILIVDDDKSIQKLFKIYLQKLGCKTIQSLNGDEAIKLYKNSLKTNCPIDAIITDLSIPDSIGGKEVARKIREINSTAKIIVSSGHTECSEMKQCKDYGFDDALDKNFDLSIIKQTLEQVFNTD